MNPIINFLTFHIPIYGICWMTGIFLAGIVAVFVSKRFKIEKYDVVCSAVFTVIGGLIGSKILFVLVSLKTIIEYKIPIINILKGGFVFYGGLIGGIIGLMIYTHKFRLPTLPFFDMMAVALPIGHACGRIGCFFAGCCYGIEYDGPLSYTYTHNIGNTPLNTPLLPIQLIEAVLLLGMFILFICLSFKAKGNGLITSLYLILYSIIRFILEFFRGDGERGMFFVFSTSQIISIILIASAVVLMIKNNLIILKK